MTGQGNRIRKFTNMHFMARIKANKSQEYMAEELNVSKKTIQNWENGVSSPSFFQSLEWFRVLSINPFPAYFSFVNNKDFSFNSDEDICKIFNNLCESLSDEDKKAILYVFLGDHGSSPTAVLQLALAYLHLPLKTRSSHTSTVIHDYNTEYMIGNLNNKEFLPNMEVLIHAFKNANESILKKLESYNLILK